MVYKPTNITGGPPSCDPNHSGITPWHPGGTSTLELCTTELRPLLLDATHMAVLATPPGAQVKARPRVDPFEKFNEKATVDSILVG